MKLGGGEAAHGIIGEQGGVAQRVDGLDDLAVGVHHISGLMAAGVHAADDLALAVVAEGGGLPVGGGGLDEPVQGGVGVIDGAAVLVIDGGSQFKL